MDTASYSRRTPNIRKMCIVTRCLPPHTTHSIRQVCNTVLAITLQDYNLFIKTDNWTERLHFEIFQEEAWRIHQEKSFPAMNNQVFQEVTSRMMVNSCRRAEGSQCLHSLESNSSITSFTSRYGALIPEDSNTHEYRCDSVKCSDFSAVPSYQKDDGMLELSKGDLACCMFSSGLFLGVWILYADVSEHCLFHLLRQVGK
jgi:hypothetical protein